MTTLTLRQQKLSPLTNQEVDDNFSNLNINKLESVVYSNLTTSGSGWFRVATTTTDGRGTYDLEVYTTGGNHDPSVLKIFAQCNWTGGRVVYAVWDEVFPASSVRVTRNATNSFLEVYFTASVNPFGVRINHTGFASGIVGYSGALTGGGDTVADTLALTSRFNVASINTSLTSAQVTSALGYTPYNSTNPSGYITSASLSSYLPLSGGTLTGNLSGTTGTFSSYITMGSLVANDPGSSYYSYTHRLGGSVAISGSILVGTASVIDPSSVFGFAAGQVTESSTGFSAPGIVIGASSGQHGAIVYGSGTMYFGTENGSDNTTSTRATLTNTGIFEATASVRAPIFYDSNDTGYYADPASTSRLNSIDTNDGNVQLYKTQAVDMSNTAVYSTSNYYPVIIYVPASGCWIEIQNNLNTNVPSWATHGSGFTLNLRWWTNGSGWGTTEVKRRVEQYHERFTNQTICGGISQLVHSSEEVVYLRGGGYYRFHFSRNLTAYPQSTNYTNAGLTASVTSTAVNTVWDSATGVHTSYNTSVFADTRIDAPIFYDRNNTSYYLNPESTSYLYNVDANFLNFRSHFDNLGPGYWYRNDTQTVIQTFNTSASNASQFNLRHSYGSTILEAQRGDLYLYGSASIANNSLRAPIFYDSNDTSYYADPASTNRLNFVNSNNHYIQPGYMLYSDHGSWQGEYNKIQWHSSHLYLQNNGGGYLLILRRGDGGERFYCDYNGNVTASGNITAYSDQRLKTNVQTIENPLQLVNKLRGVTFDWIETGKHSYGLIAQEVEQVIPELVLETTNGNTEIDTATTVKSVDYSKLVSVLIEAVKEQQQQIDKLTKLVEVLLAK